MGPSDCFKASSLRKELHTTSFPRQQQGKSSPSTAAEDVSIAGESCSTARRPDKRSATPSPHSAKLTRDFTAICRGAELTSKTIGLLGEQNLSRSAHSSRSSTADDAVGGGKARAAKALAAYAVPPPHRPRPNGDAQAKPVSCCPDITKLNERQNWRKTPNGIFQPVAEPRWVQRQRSEGNWDITTSHGSVSSWCYYSFKTSAPSRGEHKARATARPWQVTQAPKARMCVRIGSFTKSQLSDGRSAAITWHPTISSTGTAPSLTNTSGAVLIPVCSPPA